MHGHCERARQWASASVDGELSSFERALLADHLERCASCREFGLAIADLTTALRAAPRERVESISIGRVRRQVRLRLAPAVAAMAVAAVGLGSVLASVELKSGSVASVQPLQVVPVASSPDTINLSTVNVLEKLRTGAQAKSARSLRGGPVMRDQ
ncbi:MAG: zf-HC2 domain-containing protein [Gaiellaceae bacterium]